MNKDNVMKNDIKTLISMADSIAVIPSVVRGVDAFCAGVGLFHMLNAGSTGKKISFLYSDDIPQGCEDLIDKDQVQPLRVPNDLLISIDYSGNPGVQLHYSHDENDVLHLKLSPIGHDFDLNQKVKTQLNGGAFDLVITLGMTDLNSLEPKTKEFIERSEVLNLDNTAQNAKFGFLNLVESNLETLSLLVFKYSASWGLAPSTNSAKCLLKGITS